MPKSQQHIIHISGVQAFKACRQAWHWASPLGRNLTPREKYIPFFVGSLVHHCLEHKLQGATDNAALIGDYLDASCSPDERASDMVAEQARLVRGMLTHYDLWQKYDRSVLADHNFTFIANEQKFTLPLWANSRHKINLTGVFDGVVRSNHDGKTYLWEIKTTRSVIEREKQLELDAQTDAYINAASRLLGVPIAGVVYTLMRKKVPEQPNTLRTGLLSQAISQDTTVEWYLEALSKHHQMQPRLYWSDYRDFINQLIAKGNNYFKRVVINRKQHDLDDSWLQLQSVAREMIDRHMPIYRNESRNCGYCIFREPCIAKRAGRDFEKMLTERYTFNDRYAEEVTQ